MKPEKLEIEDDMETDDIAEAEEPEQQSIDIEMLDKLGLSLARTRSEHINARLECGIETEWIEDEEYYEGIDDVNRGEMASWTSKPVGSVALPTDDEEDSGSTVFFNIVRPYVDIASSRVSDMLIPTDEKPWDIGPTPRPDIVEITKGNIPERIIRQIDDQVPDPEQNKQVKDEVVAEEIRKLDIAKEAAKKAETQIEDWHVECQYNSHMRAVIESAAKIGTGVMKGPTPERKKTVAFVGGKIVVQDEIVPVSTFVNLDNCYPDLSCGNNIQNGSQHWEKDDINERDLIKLIDQPGYIKEQIARCVEEGPHSAVNLFKGGSDNVMRGLIKRDNDNLYQIWYMYGKIQVEDLEAAGCDCEEMTNVDLKLDAHVVMVNNRVIRASLNTDETGDFPYDYLPWQQRSGLPYGISVSRQIRTPQRVINGAGRNLMDNAGLAGGPMWGVNQGMLEPIDGIYEIRPRKGWYISEDAEDASDISKAFQFFTMDMMQDDLQAIINFGMRMAEQMSGLPSLIAGQQQDDARETLGSRQMRRNDGSISLRRMARVTDDKLTTPHINRYYKYILTYGDDDLKGDFKVKARGSSALVERDIQNQSIMDMAKLVSDPTYGLDKRKWAKEYLRSQRLDPANYEFDDDEWEEVLSKMSAPPPDTSMEVANLKVQFEQWKEQFKAQVKQAELQWQSRESNADRMLTMAEKEVSARLDAEMALLKQSGAKDLNIDKIKAALTETIMTLKTQVQLSNVKGKAPEVANPVVEPVGRAPDGEAFQK